MTNRTADNKTIQQAIINHIREHGAMTYSALETLLDDLHFDFRGEFGEHIRNIILWEHWNTNAIDLIRNMIQIGYIEREPCGISAYLCDDIPLPHYPIMKQSDDPFTMQCVQWLPTCFVLGANADSI